MRRAYMRRVTHAFGCWKQHFMPEQISRPPQRERAVGTEFNGAAGSYSGGTRNNHTRSARFTDTRTATETAATHYEGRLSVRTTRIISDNGACSASSSPERQQSHGRTRTRTTVEKPHATDRRSQAANSISPGNHHIVRSKISLDAWRQEIQAVRMSSFG